MSSEQMEWELLTAGQRQVAADLLRCCESWEPDVCVMGNVRAGDAAELLRTVLSTASLEPVVSVLESGATPGPWLIKRRAAPCAHNGDIGIVNSKGVLVAFAYSLGTADANARLIAAAPDLLAELENIANTNLSKWDKELRGQFREWAQSRARAAIAKATRAAAQLAKGAEK